MDLYLKNVGIISESTVHIDGLTVITGKNSSGKTTVGKVLYALLKTGNNAEKEFEFAKINYLRSVVMKIRSRLLLRQSGLTRRRMRFDEIMNGYILDAIWSASGLASFDELCAFLDKTLSELPSVFFEEWEGYLNTAINASYPEKITPLRFEQRKEEALSMASDALNSVSAVDAFHDYLINRCKSNLIQEFHGQIRPVKNPRLVSVIRIIDDMQEYISCKVSAKNSIHFQSDAFLSLPYSDALFIDNPYAIDELNKDVFLERRPVGFRPVDDIGQDETPVKTHNDKIIKAILSKSPRNYFESTELAEKLRPLMEKLDKIVPGEFARNDDGAFYALPGMMLNVQNLATGSKVFFLLKLLLETGTLTKDTMLILDEPEAHLHPEWINQFAEILTLLVSEMNISVVLTTHSPNLLLALNVFSKRYQIKDKSHFYLAKEKDNGFSQIECIDNNINEGYTHLSIPFVEMSLQRDIEDGE